VQAKACTYLRSKNNGKNKGQKKKPGAKALLHYKLYPTAEAVGLIPKAKTIPTTQDNSEKLKQDTINDGGSTKGRQ